MAATKGAMTSLPSSQAIFLPAVEDPENRINFRDSLKFFQEQLVINGANFPSPSPVCRSGNNTLRKNESHSNKENSSDKNGQVSKESDTFEEDIQSVRSCKITIPTVDTILESVRVLRAIQKSQEERGSTWNLDVSSKSDIESDFKYTDEWVQVANINQNGYSDEESNKERNDEINSTNLEGEEERNDEKNSTNLVDEFEGNDEKNSTNLVDEFEGNDEKNSKNLVDEAATKVETKLEVNGTKHEEVTESNDQSQCNILHSNSINEICPFWPSNTILNNYHTDTESAVYASVTHIETKVENVESEVYDTNIGNTEELDKTGLVRDDGSNFRVKKADNEILEQIEHGSVINDNNYLQEQNIIGNLTQSQNESVINEGTKICDSPDSLHSVCTDLLNYMNSNTQGNSEKILLQESNTSEILKIETYQDIDIQKHEDFLLNESLWKESCSPNDSTSTKIEHNDSDSGIGTQRSASSLSPNNPSQMQKDSWSDTCSSHYASAECSPYHSLNSVFESSLGLSITPSEIKTVENEDILPGLTSDEWDDTSERSQESIKESSEDQENHSIPQKIDSDKEKDLTSVRDLTDSPALSADLESHSDNAELDTEISYCNFVTNYTIEKPCERTEEKFEEATTASKICDSLVEEPKILNGHESIICDPTINKSEEEFLISVTSKDDESIVHEQTADISKEESLISVSSNDKELEDDACDLGRVQKFTAASCDLISVVESLYAIKENPAYQVLPATDASEEKFEEELFIFSKGAFCEHPEDNYLVTIEESTLHITKDSQALCSLNMKYGEVSIEAKNILKIDNRMGRCMHIRCDVGNLAQLKSRIELHCLKHWQTDCLQLVHYPLKCHQNVVIIDLGSCSTRAGILMDQPTLPRLFFPTICATDKRTGTCVYGMEALQPEVRQHSNLSFPVRPTIKITKHTIDIDLLEGLFKKIFCDLKVNPTEYTVQVCLPRNLSINAQIALVKLLLENLKVKAVSLTNQALLTLYAHDVSTAVVVNIGDRTDVLPVVDGFIVENGVTKLPHGGQRLIHHMKHGLAEKRISLSNDIDSFVVQYIIENLAYVAEDYDNEAQISSQYPDIVKKTVTLQPASSDSMLCKSITLEEARFKIPEGLFNPELWGLDSPGIHHLVQKAIQATSVDARKRIAENIYVSGGVTMLPGFVERLNKEVAKLSKTKIVPKVYASNYRYHCTYIGACKFAKMDVFPQVCINIQEFSKNNVSALKKCALCF